MDTDILLISFLIIIGLPLIQYNFRLVIIIIVIYFLIFPEKRNSIYNNLNISKKNTNNGDYDMNMNVLYQEGNSIMKELKKFKKTNSLIYQSIKTTWKNFIKLSQSVMNNTKNTYQHHVFSTLVDQRKYILNQMSALIVSNETLNLQENTLTKQRDLPLDTHIRVLIRKMITVFDLILDMVKNQINTVWSENTYNELSPVEWNTPQAYNQNNLDPII
jgi:hypothetical protein